MHYPGKFRRIKSYFLHFLEWAGGGGAKITLWKREGGGILKRVSKVTGI